MLPPNLWQPWEPRMVVPILADFRNDVDFVPQDDLFLQSWRDLVRPIHSWFRGKRNGSSAWRAITHLLLRKKITFRGVFLDRDGHYLFTENFPGAYGPGDLFQTRIDDVLRRHGYEGRDLLMNFIASHGRPDFWNSSPGSVTVRYLNHQAVSGYRTGYFARTLNETGKSHYGFTGVNAQVCVKDGYEPAILLINHSSDPTYDRSVRPTARLYRAPDQFLEALLGEIPPHGAREFALLDYFPEAEKFLEAQDGWGLWVSSAKGSTLASVHMIRNRDSHSLGMDHSRPLHTNVVQGN